jgi:ubiquinone/menaquinone biosynthesis C-methylase UbiE
MNKKERRAYDKLQINQPAQSRSDLLQMLLLWGGFGDLTDMDVLEVGCGNATFLNILRKMNPDSLTGLDINPIYESEDPKVIVGVQEELPFEDNSMDLYISSETLEHSYDHKLAIAEMYRVLRPGGKALIGLPWGNEHSDAPVHKSAIPLGLTQDIYVVKEQFENPKLEKIGFEIVHNGAFLELRILVILKEEVLDELIDEDFN